MRASIGAVIAAVVACGLGSASARVQAQEINGLWWGGYNAFQPSPDVAPGFWWDHYQPPAHPYWNGPYYTVDHWDPYIPRPVAWSPLIYNFANFPPQSTRPAGFYAQFSPGPITFPQNATQFWQYIWPNLSPETQALIGTQVGLGGGKPPEDDWIPALPPARLKQYYKTTVLGPLKGGYWKEREAPLHEQPGPRVIRGDHLGFTQYYRPQGQKYWVFRSARSPKTVVEPAKEK